MGVWKRGSREEAAGHIHDGGGLGGLRTRRAGREQMAQGRERAQARSRLKVESWPPCD